MLTYYAIFDNKNPYFTQNILFIVVIYKLGLIGQI